jgi:hypothetical protein
MCVLLVARVGKINGVVYFVFYPSFPSHHGSVWLLPVIVLTITVSPVRLAYPYEI